MQSYDFDLFVIGGGSGGAQISEISVKVKAVLQRMLEKG